MANGNIIIFRAFIKPYLLILVPLFLNNDVDSQEIFMQTQTF
jgi:hypothetical protein